MPTEFDKIRVYINIKWLVIISLVALLGIERLFGVVTTLSTISAFTALGIASLTNLILFLTVQRNERAAYLLTYPSVLFDLALIVVALYFNGGIENNWLFLPVLLIFFSGYLLTFGASLAFAALAFAGMLIIFCLDYFRILPHFTIYNLPEAYLRNPEYIADVFVGLFLLYFSAAISSGYVNQAMSKTLARQKESLVKAQEKQQESEGTRKALMNLMEDLGRSRDNLEARVKERTAELEEAKDGLEIKVFERTTDLEQSRKAILHMMKDLKEDVTKLQAIDRMKTEFLSMVSHELRTPITPIKGYLTLMLGGKVGQFSTEQKKALNVLLRQSDHLQDLIDSLLDISRLELNKEIPITKEPLSIKKLLEDVVESDHFAAEQRGLALKLEIDKTLPTFMGDAIKLKRILANLLGNAIKFTPKGGTVILRATSDPANLRIEVADNGIGIEADCLEKIFDKFFQVDSSYTRASGGIGMGLAIARELVAVHGGKIWAESQGPGKGSKVIFTLPLDK